MVLAYMFHKGHQQNQGRSLGSKCMVETNDWHIAVDLTHLNCK